MCLLCRRLTRATPRQGSGWTLSALTTRRPTAATGGSSSTQHQVGFADARSHDTRCTRLQGLQTIHISYVASGLGEAISGCIMFEETLYQSTADGKPFVDVLRDQGIVPGIKVDTGESGEYICTDIGPDLERMSPHRRRQCRGRVASCLFAAGHILYIMLASGNGTLCRPKRAAGHRRRDCHTGETAGSGARDTQCIGRLVTPSSSTVPLPSPSVTAESVALPPKPFQNTQQGSTARPCWSCVFPLISDVIICLRNDRAWTVWARGARSTTSRVRGLPSGAPSSRSATAPTAAPRRPPSWRTRTAWRATRRSARHAETAARQASAARTPTNKV